MKSSTTAVALLVYLNLLLLGRTIAFLVVVHDAGKHKPSYTGRRRLYSWALNYVVSDDDNNSNDGSMASQDAADPNNNKHVPVHEPRSSSLISEPPPLNQAPPSSPEWHDAFLRNQLGDFCPSVTQDQILDCLVLGGGQDAVSNQSADRRPSTLLPWVEESVAQQAVNIYTLPPSSSSSSEQQDTISSASSSLLTARRRQAPGDTTKAMTHTPMYDCIFDRGLMDAILASSSSGEGGEGQEGTPLILPITTTTFDAQQQDGPITAVTGGDDASSSISTTTTATTTTTTTAMIDTLLRGASRAIREYGIYVMTTRTCLLTTQVKEYLTARGGSLGMEWKFGLDGITNESVSVSVARRFFSGTLPSMGLAVRTATDEEEGTYNNDKTTTRLPPGEGRLDP